MPDHAPFDIYLVAPPGLEPALAAEAAEKGFADPVPSMGGVTLRGGWPEVWRANLELRGATKVLARIGSFRALHLAQLDKRARKFPWGDILRPDQPVKVEATCKGSRIYHAGAAAQRIETALREELGVPIADDAGIRLLARIEDDLCTFSVDASGELLHKRGHKEAVNKAPMRETLAALVLRECGYTGAEPVLDPMCGSGTFVIEAAEIALGLPPGRSRSFAFERLATFDPAAWDRLRRPPAPRPVPFRFLGSDRDSGAVAMSRANAGRAGVAGVAEFLCQPISDLRRPEGPPGLVIVNPPYGTRIGNKKPLFGLYAALGEVLRERFAGWRVGLVTSEPSLARATGLPFAPLGPAVAHGGLSVHLHRTPGPLR
ncbi:THUMP domain-containing class I SAM-dependent RNA methyltransferase [Rubellimicrobium aerolatum]|uniref:Class I SAM-dependent RNA methyltransferase n=1 Tax=Rubellimicrobium aerolatum TaxID=490979 RepID=A0ABW0SFF6_9RHOB|nr:class I SAM-dependent RNA methyltransferase [Rubellimicrobium aerolatum]MBP1807052.1 putative N6-adenine-specific DNA methylase [Rubellimicrobium aerolatum]